MRNTDADLGMMGRLDFISRISFFLGRSLVLFSIHEVVGFGLAGRAGR